MQEFSSHPHWSGVMQICTQLQAAGHQALLAGGCVRDWLMGRNPNDFDVATSAHPDEVEKLFPGSITVGRAFGVIIVPKDGYQIEIATFRTDGPYLDGRRPSSIEFADPKKDAERRDFTVNALFYDLQSQKVLDFVGGKQDLDAKRLKTVGLARSRFEEDKLRILRAVRFAAQLDFAIEAETWEAVKNMAFEIRRVSPERIREEWLKLLRTRENRKGLRLLQESQLFEEIWPDYALWCGGEGQAHWAHTIDALDRAVHGETSTSILMALFFLGYYNFKPSEERLKSVDTQLRVLKFSNREIAEVVWCLSHYEHLLAKNADPGEVPPATTLLALAHPSIEILKKIILSQESAAHSSLILAKWQQWQKEYLQEGKLPRPLLTGEALKELGILPSPRFGEILSEVYNQQLQKKLQTMEEAMAKAKELMEVPPANPKS